MLESLKQKTPGLLPYRFKMIGMTILVLSISPIVIVKILGADLDQSSKEVLKLITVNVFLTGLFLIACSRDKVEDERNMALRLKSIYIAFIVSVIHALLTPVINIFLRYPIEDFSAQSMIMIILFIYLALYYLQKKGKLSFGRVK